MKERDSTKLNQETHSQDSTTILDNVVEGVFIFSHHLSDGLATGSTPFAWCLFLHNLVTDFLNSSCGDAKLELFLCKIEFIEQLYPWNFR